MCGIFATISKNKNSNLSKIIFYGLLSQNHRGQECAGISVSDGYDIHSSKGIGMINQIFHEEDIIKLEGNVGIGHCRYSTDGDKNSHENIQPYKIITEWGPIAISYNGNLTRSKTLREKILKSGRGLQSTVDTELIAQILCENENSPKDGIDRIKHFMDVCDSAYSMVLMSKDSLYACRDIFGYRPLCLGKIVKNNSIESYIISSESCGLDAVGAEYIREIEAGEIIKINKNLEISSINSIIQKIPGLCIFEYIYFSRPDSILNNKNIHNIRQKLGAKLYQENKHLFQNKDNFVVTGVPDSATPFGIGFSNESGIKYTECFTKNRYVHRTFIQPTNDIRKSKVRSKFNPIVSNVFRKNIILIDDSIVRGNTICHLIDLLKSKGANRVDVLIGSPPVISQCYMGIDMKTKEEMCANNKSLDELKTEIGADSLNYLTITGMNDIIGKQGYCRACFDGKYLSKIDW